MQKARALIFFLIGLLCTALWESALQVHGYVSRVDLRESVEGVTKRRATTILGHKGVTDIGSKLLLLLWAPQSRVVPLFSSRSSIGVESSCTSHYRHLPGSFVLDFFFPSLSSALAYAGE